MDDIYRREADHRVANSLQIAASALRQDAREVDDPEAREALERATLRLSGIARLHRRLSAGPIGETVDIHTFLDGLKSDLAEAIGIDCRVSSEQIPIASEKAVKLGLVLNEIAINAFKHAYGGAEAGELSITARRGPSGMVHIAVSDGGPGLPDDFAEASSRSTGFAILRAIVEDLDGTLRVVTDGGARYEIRFPV